jgi:hypothetical protein
MVETSSPSPLTPALGPGFRMRFLKEPQGRREESGREGAWPQLGPGRSRILQLSSYIGDRSQTNTATLRHSCG